VRLFAEHFVALDAFICKHQALWRPRPFTLREMPWEQQYLDLAQWLRQRTLEQAEAVHNWPASLAAPAPFPEWAAEAQALSDLARLPMRHLEVDARLARDVPGRKWQQIQAFAASAVFSQAPQHWLDWCAGKGHLGRVLVTEGTALSCVEWDAELVAAGQQLSARHGIAAHHQQQDVLAEGAVQCLDTQHTPVALHACGDLHVRLLQLAIERGCRQLAVAPCCYNRIQQSHYQPLSSLAKASPLRLDLDDLRLPLSETVTAGQRVRRQRDQSMAWRLGFDSLQRQLRQVDEYLPTPSLAPSWLHKSFAQYCQDLGALRQLQVPAAQDWAHWEALGWQRLAEVRNLELVRGLFRRPLELWLLLDRALLLEEHGYQVRLGTFCAPELTPRNLLLLAERL